jgi:uncharacterized protein (TIGR03067 family)
MLRIRFFFATLFVFTTLQVNSSVRGEEPTRVGKAQPSDDPIRAVLLKKGYTAIPLLPGDETESRYRVKCRCGSEDVFFLLDTGAAGSVLDAALAKKLKLESVGKTEFYSFTGRAEADQVRLRGMEVGEFDTRTAFNTLPMTSFDLSMSTKPVKGKQNATFQGVLGHQALSLCSAVIDYSTHTLYLRQPLGALWPQVEGKWTAVGGEENGERLTLDAKSAPVFEFKSNCIHVTIGETKYHWGIHVRPDESSHVLALFDPKTELDERCEYTALGLLKVTNGKLTVCLARDVTKLKALPTEFAAPKGSGLLLLEFEQQGKAEKK